MSLQKSIASVVIDKMFDGIFIVAMAVPALLLGLRAITLSQAAIVAFVELGVGTLLFVGWYAFWLRLGQRLLSAAVRLLQRLPFLKSGQLEALEQLQRLDELSALQRKIVMPAFWLTLFGQAMWVLRSWMIARAFGLEISLLAAFMGVALAQAALFLGFTPAGLGITDAGWFIALSGAGVPAESITVFLIASRGFNLAVIAIVSLLTYLGLLTSNRLVLAAPDTSRINESDKQVAVAARSADDSP